jgi:hypothetical protein
MSCEIFQKLNRSQQHHQRRIFIKQFFGVNERVALANLQITAM